MLGTEVFSGWHESLEILFWDSFIHHQYTGKVKWIPPLFPHTLPLAAVFKINMWWSVCSFLIHFSLALPSTSPLYRRARNDLNSPFNFRAQPSWNGVPCSPAVSRGEGTQQTPAGPNSQCRAGRGQGCCVHQTWSLTSHFFCTYSAPHQPC